ncbi:hypothetical protein ASG43_08890 [Aureimonas sp. Leaf454]|uniref:hypothetical protein n=1 Tax=Aureimonas sp. Leaf454 TaxID=1736381 RepID=UPI0006F313F0|nr:hypothetical protein [Aureimonas sp. Leaf454]KQT48939.1 hypothetical protein ASG43_08890 [Aureimonas sp. Leaf454]
MGLTVKIKGDGIDRMQKAMKALGDAKGRRAYQMAVNDAGNKAKTATSRALAKQSGLKVGVTKRALKPTAASGGDLNYTLKGEGGNIAVKYFAPKETDSGVSANPWGKRATYANAFMSGGEWPGGRKGFIGRGHAFYKAGGSRLPIKRAKSGVVIPDEMVKGVTVKTFEDIGLSALDERVLHQIQRASKGLIS